MAMQGRSQDQRELLDAESVAGHLLKPGSVYAFLAEHRKVLFPDQMFADLFPSGRGRPSVPADVMAAVIVLQPLRKLRYRPAPVVCSGRLAGSPRRRMFRPVLGW